MGAKSHTCDLLALLIPEVSYHVCGEVQGNKRGYDEDHDDTAVDRPVFVQGKAGDRSVDQKVDVSTPK